VVTVGFVDPASGLPFEPSITLFARVGYNPFFGTFFGQDLSSIPYFKSPQR
jgi:hypothetical protein